MFNILEILRKNRATYYDFSTGEKSPIMLSYFIKILLAILLSYLFANIGKDFLNAVITIYAILIGFSFNILFYLLSINKTAIDKTKDSLETQIKIEKANKLTDELFYNVSYFNIASILVIITTLVFFLFDSQVPNFFSDIPSFELLQQYSKDFELHLLEAIKFFLLVYRIFFYLLLLESLHCFIRTVGRVSFYFQEKIKLQNCTLAGRGL